MPQKIGFRGSKWGTLKTPEKPWPGPDGWDASRWYGRPCVQKLTLSVLNCAHAPGQSFHDWHFLIRLLSPLIIVDNSPNMHNTCFFPDCQLLSLTDGSIGSLFLARYSEIFKEPNFQVVKVNSMFIWKIFPGRNWQPKDVVWLQFFTAL